MKASRRKNRPILDATTEIIHGIEKGVVGETIAQREYDMGYKSVQIIQLMAEKGVRVALQEMGAVDGVIAAAVDVTTAENLEAYQASLDALGILHEWRVKHSPRE